MPTSERISFLLPRSIFAALFNSFMPTPMGSPSTPRKMNNPSSSSGSPQDAPRRKPLTPINTHVQQSSPLPSASTSRTSSTACSTPPNFSTLKLTKVGRSFEYDLSSPQRDDDDSGGPSTPRISIVSPITPPYSSPSDSPARWVHSQKPQTTVYDDLASPASSSSSSLGFSEGSPKRFSETGVPRVGPFKFIRSLCRGSYGVAYAARDLQTSRVVCAKVFKKDILSTRNDRFIGSLTELVAYQQISNADEHARKWLMELHGVVQDASRVLFVMDLMDCDLFTMLQKPVSKSVLRHWIAQTALGIDALHNMGIIHRDIKPENIFITPGTSNIRIGDFTNAWVASLEDGNGPFSEGLVEPGAPLDWWKVYSRHLIGTREYLAPEMRAREWYGPMVDWWALGCLVFDLLVGDALFPEERTLDLYLEHQELKMDAHEYFAIRSKHLSIDDKSLLAGLLTVSPHKRFRLEHLEEHPFFIDYGRNVFENLRDISLAASRKATRSARRDLEVSPTSRSELLCYARPGPCVPELNSLEEQESQDTFGTFGWINPRGIWATR